MNRFILYTLLIIVFLPLAVFAQDSPVSYSFFVAGHTYGKPGVDNVGLHPPFKEKFDYIRNREEIQLGFLTGDIVKRGSVKDWDEVDADIETLEIPVYFAAGNHDMSERALFESRYGITYYYFTRNNDLFIILDPNLDNWNISGDQLDFLITTLNDQVASSDNIFVFFHQMLWWSDDNIYQDLHCNSIEGRAQQINFWTDIEPLFHNLENEVYMFAGDVGAGSWASDVAYDHYDNISFIASGMGEGPGDNFVVVNIHTDKSISYDLICLNDPNLNCLGNLTDYRISSTIEEPGNETQIKIYPNPIHERLFIEYHLNISSKIMLFNLSGQVLLESEVLANSNTTIDLTELVNGIYFLKLVSTEGISCHKIIKR
ncbi:MAG: T9SS type A sorting domain-containing protein [Bacteroidota bacterium]|nr:T9SS type A sorting domain-containing protein [Bacteroidota bacterium]